MIYNHRLYIYELNRVRSPEGQMQVSKWGNSLAIRLPAVVVDVLGLKEGDQVEVEVANARNLRIARVDAADKQALSRLRKLRGSLPADFTFDRMEANARGR